MKSVKKPRRKNLEKRKKKSMMGGKRERVEKSRGQGFREVEYGYGSRWQLTTSIAMGCETTILAFAKQGIAEGKLGKLASEQQGIAFQGNRVEKANTARAEMAPMMERKTVKKGSKSRQVPSGVKKGRGSFRVGKWISEGLRGERKANPGLAKGYALVLAARVVA